MGQPPHHRPPVPPPGYGPPPTGYGPAAGYGAVPGYGPAAADLGTRIAAYVVDMVVATVVFFGVYLVLGAGGGIVLGTAFPDRPGPAVGAVLVAAALGLAAMFCYLWLPVARSGQTVGKRLLRIRVVASATGWPPSRGAAAARVAVFFAVGLVPFGQIVNLVLAAVDEPAHQALHDRAAATRVVRA